MVITMMMMRMMMRANRTVKRTRIATTGFGTQFWRDIKDNHIQDFGTGGGGGRDGGFR